VSVNAPLLESLLCDADLSSRHIKKISTVYPEFWLAVFWLLHFLVMLSSGYAIFWLLHFPVIASSGLSIFRLLHFQVIAFFGLLLLGYCIFRLERLQVRASSVMPLSGLQF
jgi:hypothetical protein